MGYIIDISHHQPSRSINWDKWGDIVDLLIIRTSDGTGVIDREYKNHAANAKKQGIPFGHYMFNRFKNKAQALEEAELLHKMAIDGAKFLVLDLEADLKDVVVSANAAIDYLKDKGWTVGVYVAHNKYNEFGADRINADFMWIPRYPSTPSFTHDLHQYTQTGKVAGYSGGLDLNKLSGSKDLSFFTGAKTAKKDTEKATEKPKATSGGYSGSTYVVKSGDTLSEIAVITGRTVDQLRGWNGIKGDLIHPGDKLRLTSPKTSTPAKASSGTYKVKSGDTLSHIAVDKGTTVAALKSANGLKSDLIKVGQTLKIPNGSTKKTETYKIVSGDTLSGIAAKKSTTVSAIKKLNDLKSDTIYAGDTIKIP